MAWPFQLKFEIYIFGVMILQMKQKTKLWKIELNTFNQVLLPSIGPTYYLAFCNFLVVKHELLVIAYC